MQKKYIIFDTETAGPIDAPLVYDFAAAVVDAQGNIYETYEALIAEIYNDADLMAKAYYSRNIPYYNYRIERGQLQVRPWTQVRRDVVKLTMNYDINEAFAYNATFDDRSTRNTGSVIEDRHSFFSSDIEIKCIWQMASQTIIDDDYVIAAAQRGWISAAGNPITKAENIYRYISGKYEFEEAHTALADVLIEAEIMRACMRHKNAGQINFSANMGGMQNWRGAQTIYKRLITEGRIKV